MFDDTKLILTGVYVHKFSNIELIALRSSTMYAKTGVKTIVADLVLNIIE